MRTHWYQSTRVNLFVGGAAVQFVIILLEVFQYWQRHLATLAKSNDEDWRVLKIALL